MGDKIIRRYTDVASLLHILTHKEITLLDPNTWDDKNDSKFMEIYKSKEGIKSILVLCFTDAPETYHHWKVFAPGNAGVCIRFKKPEFLKCIDDVSNVTHGKVDYKKLDDLRKISPKTQDLPFIKRYPFRDEEEYRIIYVSKNNSQSFKNLKIDISSISRIVLSPWLHKSLADTLKKTLKSINGCEDIPIYTTTLNENKNWISYGKKSV